MPSQNGRQTNSNDNGVNVNKANQKSSQNNEVSASGSPGQHQGDPQVKRSSAEERHAELHLGSPGTVDGETHAQNNLLSNDRTLFNPSNHKCMKNGQNNHGINVDFLAENCIDCIDVTDNSQQTHRSPTLTGQQPTEQVDEKLCTNSLSEISRSKKKRKKCKNPHLKQVNSQERETEHSVQPDAANSSTVKNDTEHSVEHEPGATPVPSHEPDGPEFMPTVCLLDSRSHDNNLKVTMGNVNARALVDTGATVSCISTTLLDKIDPHFIEYLKSEIPFVCGVGGKQHEVTHKVKIQFSVENKPFSQTFYALQNPFELILGMDFISEHKAKMDFENSHIILDGEKFQLQPQPCRTTLTKTYQTEIILPFSSQDIPVKLSNGLLSQVMLIEPVSSLQRNFPSLEIAESLVSDKTSLCRVTNSSDSPIFIPPNVVIGIARTISVHALMDPVSLEDCCLIDDPESQAAGELNFDDSASGLTPELAQRLTDQLVANTKRFTTGDLENLGDHEEHSHPVHTSDKRPNTQGSYRTAPKMQREISRQIEVLLKHGIIEPSCSEWQSPVVLVKKKDGSYRFACDYRRLNDLTEKMSYPMPKLEDVWDLIGEVKPQYFSVLDLASGFWQIRMDPATKHKAAFVCQNGQFVWNRMPFGLKNSPITFQQTMNDVLRDLITKCCIVYVDDIIVFSKDFDTHLEDLQKVFDRLEKANLTLKLSKCQFAVQRVKYLGHVLSTEGISPDPEKLNIVQNWSPPKNPKQVRQFLGLTNYYRRFVPNYANIAKPLHNLTKKEQPWHWDTKCQQSFEKLRESLVTPPCLAYPDMERPFILTTDASNVAISYILSQKNQDNVEHVIAYAGRGLRNAEINYSITDKEGLAVVEGFQHFHTYLCGNFTTVITDHSALVYIKNNTKLTGRVARWAILLQNYEYTIIHRKGVDNTNADALSRVEVPTDINHDPQKVEEIEPRHIDVFTVYEADELEKHAALEVIFDLDNKHTAESAMQIKQIDMPSAQHDCPEIGPMYKYIQTGVLPDDDNEAKSIILHAVQYGMFADILYHIHKPCIKDEYKFDKTLHQIVIPKDLRYHILSDYHDSLVGGGHQGFQRTYDAIRSKYFWRGMYSDTKDYQQSCGPCQRSKRPHTRPTPLHPLPVAGLFRRWHMDFIGPLRQSADGKKYILLVVDSFSRWPEAFALPSADAITVARVLYKEIFTRYGAPHSLVSDRGPQFVSSLVKALCEIFNVTRTLTSPYHPQTNAACERFNSYLEATMRTYVSPDQSDWPCTLPGILMAYRNTQAHRSTEFSPYYLLFGEPMYTPIDREITANIPEVSAQYRGTMKSVLDNVKLSRKVAEENIVRHQQQNKELHDRRAVEPDYVMGDLVWLYDPKVPVGYSKKIRAQWVGPYNICEIGPNGTYRLRHAQTREITSSLINAGRLKPATAHEQSAIRVKQQRLHSQLRQERVARRAVGGQNDPGGEVPQLLRPGPQRLAPPDQLIEHADRQDGVTRRAVGGQNDPGGEVPQLLQPGPQGLAPPDSQPHKSKTAKHPPVEKVVQVKKVNKVMWYKVKFKDTPGNHWRSEGFVDIDKDLIEDCLKRCTLAGTPRKRRK